MNGEPKKPLTEEEKREKMEKLEEIRKKKRAEREEREKKEVNPSFNTAFQNKKFYPSNTCSGSKFEHFEGKIKRMNPLLM